MLTPLQISMIKFDIKNISRGERQRRGDDNIIRQHLAMYGIPATRKNYNSVKIILNNL